MLPLACNMAAFAADERRRYAALRARITDAIEDVVELTDGYRARLGTAVTIAEAREWIALEQRCCPFLTLGLQDDRGTLWLALTGPAGVKAVLAAEFGFSSPGARGDE
jgi:hypothetical protein